MAAPTAAPKIGTSLSDPMKMYLSDIYTVAVNLAGLPGLTVPCSVNEKGLPIGVQLLGDCFRERPCSPQHMPLRMSAVDGYSICQKGDLIMKQYETVIGLEGPCGVSQRRKFSADAKQISALNRTPICARSVRVCRDLFLY